MKKVKVSQHAIYHRSIEIGCRVSFSCLSWVLDTRASASQFFSSTDCCHNILRKRYIRCGWWYWRRCHFFVSLLIGPRWCPLRWQPWWQRRHHCFVLASIQLNSEFFLVTPSPFLLLILALQVHWQVLRWWCQQRQYFEYFTENIFVAKVVNTNNHCYARI